MPFTELFTALETRTVDGQENPTTLILNARFYEVQRHLSLTRHAYTAGILAMSKQKWEGLQPAQRDLIQAVADEVTPQQRAMNEEAETSSVEELKRRGMQVVEQPDRAAFAAIVSEEVRREFAARFGAELPNAIEATRG